ncbi:prepilin-type N-terminal cleavage/methylation domain-containing protein [bacterium]|nr:prepilin-type N-terminal cleavage/methylation domain-containing protein [bacterium]
MKRRGFTLIEVVLASLIMSVLLAALYGVYAGAYRLRERVWNDIQTAAPIDEVVRVMRGDLAQTVIPGVLGKPFAGLTQTNASVRRDTLDFGSTSGVLLDSEPWGDVIGVRYELIDPENGNGDAGMDLARTVSRNLLAQTAEASAPQRLLHGVNALEFDYWDGQYWRDSWDSSVETALPPAVKVRIEFAEIDKKPARSPIEMVCPVMADNTTQTTTTDTSGGTEQ